MMWVWVFTVCLVMDYVWARYIHHTAKGNATRAALWSMAVLVLSAASIIAYTENHWLLIPSAAGCFVGTYLATSKPLAKIVASVEKHMRQQAGNN